MLLCVSATDNRGQGTKKRSHVESKDDGDDQATENAHACDQGNRKCNATKNQARFVY